MMTYLPRLHGGISTRGSVVVYAMATLISLLISMMDSSLAPPPAEESR
jgi:hypothetical protein